MVLYCRQLLKIGLVRKYTTEEYVSASLVEPKHSPAMYHLSFDDRPVEIATSQTFDSFLDMSKNEAKLIDDRGTKEFEAIDFFCRYWQSFLSG